MADEELVLEEAPTEESVVEEPIVEEEPVVEAPDTTKVHPLHYIADRRREYTVIVDSDEKKAWLMPSGDVPGDFEFEVPNAALKVLAKPYEFKSEIKDVMPTQDDVKRALWLKGIVTLDDLANVREVRHAIAHVTPSANAFLSYVGE